MAEERRPIKVVMPQPKDYLAPRPGGETKMLVPVDDDLINSLDSQLVTVQNTFGSILQDSAQIPVVAKVTLREKAYAKSHHPDTLFNKRTCPVIGGGNLGELLVSVNRTGLANLRRQLRVTTNKNKAAVSTVQSVEPFLFQPAKEVFDSATTKSPLSVKVRLFNHRDAAENLKLERAFRGIAKQLQLSEPEELHYASGLRLYKVPVKSADAASALGRFVGVQSVSPMPHYGVDTQAIYIEAATVASLPPPDSKVQYPVVGLLDSGTDPDNLHLQAWVIGRDEEDVPKSDQSNLHGSFVAGLLINARGLNADDPRFPAEPCKIFDAVVIPKKGALHEEEDLVNSIRRVISFHHEKIKIWNLSISSVDECCRDEYFSEFAMAIDEIQDEFDVTIVTCTGNLTPPKPMRRWPIPTPIGEADRMLPAADSVRAVSVDSIAHQHRPNSFAESEKPSPFSRRGPGPAFIPKPDLSHYGGN